VTGKKWSFLAVSFNQVALMKKTRFGATQTVAILKEADVPA